MKLKPLKFDRGWKILLYFDLALPAILYLIALLFPVAGIRSVTALMFHSYGMYIIKTVPDFAALTGIIGVIYHAAIIVYTIIKRNKSDFISCVSITLLVTLFYAFEINYQIIKPLSFG